MKNNMGSNKSGVGDIDIDLIDIIGKIWNSRKIIYRSVAVCFFLGIIYAFTSKVEYESVCRVLPENQDQQTPDLGSLGSLAGLAGINLNGLGTTTLTPDLYPELAQSFPFQIQMINEPLFFQKKDTLVSSYTFLKKISRPSLTTLISRYTIGLPYRIKEWIYGRDTTAVQTTQGLIRMSRSDELLLKGFMERISIEVDSKSGIISITTQMPDPYAAAELASKSVDLLTKYVIDYKINKAKVSLNFIQARFDEKKREFENAQQSLAEFTDRNRNVTTALAQVELQRLQNEYNIAFEVYKGLATQLEQAQIQVKRETPVFTLIDPAKIPSKKSSPKRIIILFGSVFMGVLIGIGFIFSQKIVADIKRQ